MAGNDSTITITILAKDLASGQIGKLIGRFDAMAQKGGIVGSVLQGVGQRFGQMLDPVRLVGMAIGEVTQFLAKGIESAIEEEKSLASLDTALKNNIAGWDGNRDAIDKAIASSMKMAFTDDDLRASLGFLVAATNDQEKALRLQNLAMDIARGRNIDLASATQLVLKANMGNVGALRRAGIAIDKNATSTEILAMLNQTYAGQAEAYTETLIGSAEAVQIAMDEVSEKIGTRLLPVAKDLANTMADDVVPAMADFTDVLLSAFSGSELDVNNSFVSKFRDAFALIPGMKEQLDAIFAQADVDAMAARAYAGGQKAMASIIGVIEGSGPGIRSATGTAMSGFVGAVQQSTLEAQKIARESALAIGNNLADGLRSNKGSVTSVMDDLMWAINHPLKLEKEVARVEGALTSSNLQKALASKNPMIAAQAAQSKARLEALWQSLTTSAWTEGSGASTKLDSGLGSHYPEIKTEARGLVNDINSIWGGIRPPGFGGAITGRGVGRGPGGKRRAAGGPVRADEPYIVGEERPELFIPNQSGYIAPSVPAARGITLNVTFNSLALPSIAAGQALAQTLVPHLTREMRRQRILD